MQGADFVLRILLVWVGLSGLYCAWSPLCFACKAISVRLLRLQLNGSHQNLEFIATFISLLLLYISLIITSPTDPFLKMTKHLLSYSYVSLHRCRSWYGGMLQFVIHQSNPLLADHQCPYREIVAFGPALWGGKLEAPAQSHNPLNLRTQKQSL